MRHQLPTHIQLFWLKHCDQVLKDADAYTDPALQRLENMKRIKRRLLHAIQIFNQLVTAKHLLRDFLRILVGFCLGFLCHRLLSPTTGFGHARTSRGEEWGRDGNRRSDGSWQYAPAAIMECPPCPISCSNDAALAVEQLQLTRYRPRTRFEVIAYNYVDAAGQLYGNYDDEPRIGAPGHQRRALRRLLSHAEQLLQHRHGPACRLGSLLAGYHRYEPGEFAEYVLDVVVKNAVNGSQFVDRLELFTPLGGIIARQGALTPSSETIYFVLPATTSALPRLRAFLRRYGDEFLARGENVHLLVVVTTDDGGRGGVNEVKAMLKSLWREQSTTYVRVIELDGPFSR
ncbi:PREDICTED: uncharacterized protein LOC106813915 [Priapulus caudatus]|uniref:Hexosyltransferase n=1 Tax=Priapulus caudatus TaxID=37621 RepID=A0ABM1EN74_PRICU|nr:PREDICTED: uncharacterized protein LOC106813915 [Priapulus caudatus]